MRPDYNAMMSQSSEKPALRWFLREWRKAKKLKQHQIADHMGTVVSVVSELESGKKRMNDDWIAGWASALGISPPDLLRHPDEMGLESSAEGRRLAELYFSLPDEARANAVNFLEFETAKSKGNRGT